MPFNFAIEKKRSGRRHIRGMCGSYLPLKLPWRKVTNESRNWNSLLLSILDPGSGQRAMQNRITTGKNVGLSFDYVSKSFEARLSENNGFLRLGTWTV